MKKFFIWSGLIVFLLILLIWFGTPWMLSLSTADYDGEISVNGITTPVDITFDARGIPQVWAANDADLYFSLGYLHASERLFQMELVRRLSKGELSALFGAAALGTDKWQRTVGFARKAEEDIRELPPAERDILQAYCAGINAWKNSKTILPPEFFILQLEPEDWTALDCVTIMLYQTWYSHSLRNFDGRYRNLITKLGEDLHSVLREYKIWSPATVPDGILSSLFPTPDHTPLSMSMASNSWVVAPGKSTSGAALHASDPHLQINSVPGFWYAVGLHSPSINVLGITAPGIPFVSMGHNGRIAYAFTVAAVDIIDRVHFPYSGNDTTQVLSVTGPVKLRTVYEEIPVKDEASPRRVAILLTDEGPVTDSDSSGVYAMKWAGYDFSAADIMSA
ncbi:MAG: penicillin acylase family protein, partial [Calditrichota bacterium]